MAAVQLYPIETPPFEKITLDTICGNDSQSTVMYWAPFREEIQRFVEVAKAVHTGEGLPTILEVGCGSGLLSYLLARTGEVQVIGMDPDELVLQRTPYRHPNLTLEVGDSTDAVTRYGGQDIAMVLNSWMPIGLNLTPDLRAIHARTIGLVHEPIFTGTPESYEPGGRYREVYRWRGQAKHDVRELVRHRDSHGRTPRPQLNLNESIIQIRDDIATPYLAPIAVPETEKYAWQREMERLKVRLGRIYDAEAHKLL